MKLTNRFHSSLVSFDPNSLPDVADVRPSYCDQCRHPAIKREKIFLHGHGVRIRKVIVLPALIERPERLGECWERRYRCTVCRHVLVVLPRGVMPRYLYCIPSIVYAFFLVAGSPVGTGKTHAEAYELQGMHVITAPTDGYRYRWRSLKRWARQGQNWWSFWTGRDLSSLLIGFLERSAGNGMVGAVCAALDGHVRWGCPM